MSDVLKQNLYNLLRDENAVAFCMDIFEAAQIFDDIYDTTVGKLGIYQLISVTMSKIPRNPFYRTFYAQLQPLIESVFLQWQSANAIEESPTPHGLSKAFMLRAAVYQLFHYCAFLLHGNSYALQHATLFQELYGETFEEYAKEFK